MTGYAFGDSDQAVERLARLAEVFAPASARFLRGSVRFPVGLALDLGCGAGHTTSLLAATLRPARTVGLDASARVVEVASAGAGDGQQFLCHDITTVPFPVGPADLIYARLLLSHLPDPAAALAAWATQLAPGGLLLLDEVDAISTEDPVLTTYLEVVSDLLAHRGHRLSPGPLLDALPDPPGLHRQSSAVATLSPGVRRAATMFNLNLQVWGDDPYVRRHHPDLPHRLATDLTRLANAPDRDAITWSMRQIVYRHARV